NIFVLRKTLGETVGDHRYIVTLPGRGYRFTEKVRVISEEEGLVVADHFRSRVVIEERNSRRTLEISMASVVLSLLALGVAAGYRHYRPRQGGQSATALPMTIRPRRSVAVLGFQNL